MVASELGLSRLLQDFDGCDWPRYSATYYYTLRGSFKEKGKSLTMKNDLVLDPELTEVTMGFYRQWQEERMKSLREIAATTPAEDPLEASITRTLLKYLNSLPRARFQKRHGSRVRRSEPDITGCLDGEHWEIEVKRGDNVPTKAQYSRLEDWQNAGAVVCWVTTKQQLQKTVELRVADGYEPGDSSVANVRKYAHNLI